MQKLTYSGSHRENLVTGNLEANLEDKRRAEIKFVVKSRFFEFTGTNAFSRIQNTGILQDTAPRVFPVTRILRRVASWHPSPLKSRLSKRFVRRIGKSRASIEGSMLAKAALTALLCVLGGGDPASIHEYFSYSGIGIVMAGCSQE